MLTGFSVKKIDKALELELQVSLSKASALIEAWKRGRFLGSWPVPFNRVKTIEEAESYLRHAAPLIPLKA